MKSLRVYNQQQSGVALLLVLWVMALLTILLGGFLLIARTDQLQTRYLADATRARYAAEAGINRAVYELRRQDPLTRWVADGRSYALTFDDMALDIAITDESGKIDINVTDQNTLLALFIVVGIDEQQARALVDAVLDWRDPDDLVRAQGAEKNDYEAAELTYAPTNRGFSIPSELQQVMGMSYEVYRKLEPHITVYTRNPRPNYAFASTVVLQTIPGLQLPMAEEMVRARYQLNGLQLAQTPITLPDGTTALAVGGSQTYTIESKATLPNGTWTKLSTTVRLGGVPGGRPYAILRWQEGGVSKQ